MMLKVIRNILRLREIVLITSGFLGAAAGPCLADTFVIDYSIDGWATDTIVPYVGGNNGDVYQPLQFFTPVGTTLNIGISIIDTTQTPAIWETRVIGGLGLPPTPLTRLRAGCGLVCPYRSHPVLQLHIQSTPLTPPKLLGWFAQLASHVMIT
jgi:hypothetical protein